MMSIVVAATTLGAQPAIAAKRINLVETGRLKFVNEEGSTIYEHGSAKGTYSGTVNASFLIHPKSLVVSVSLHTRGGTISGVAHADYEVKGRLGYFGGTLTLGHATGAYSHMSEIGHKGPGFSGIINRNTLEVEVKVNGAVNL